MRNYVAAHDCSIPGCGRGRIATARPRRGTSCSSGAESGFPGSTQGYLRCMGARARTDGRTPVASHRGGTVGHGKTSGGDNLTATSKPKAAARRSTAAKRFAATATTEAGGCRAGGRRRRHRPETSRRSGPRRGGNRRHDERERTPPANHPRAHTVGGAPTARRPPGVCRCGPPPRSRRPASIPEVRYPARPRTRGPPPRLAHTDRTRQRRTPTAAGPPTPPRAWCCGRSRPPSNG